MNYKYINEFWANKINNMGLVRICRFKFSPIGVPLIFIFVFSLSYPREM